MPRGILKGAEMPDLNVQGASKEDGHPSGFTRRTELRLLIESAVMTEIHLHESHRSASASTLRAELRTVCMEAKRLNLHAEQLLLTLKDVWHSIPAARAHARPADAQSLLDRLVTMVLDEYYRESTARA